MKTFETLKFYRGVSSNHPLDRAVVIKPRQNRRPRDTKIDAHELADKWFLSKFGIAYRSQSVLITSQFYIAQGYAASPAHVVRVIPLSDYKFCWSTKISDMLMLCMSPSDTRPLEKRLEEAGYIDSDLHSAHDSGNEVMLSCNNYISIPVGLLNEEVQPKNISNIILL